MDGESPRLPKLQKELKKVVDWFSLGLQLDVPYEELEKMAVNFRNDVERCKLEMLNYWLNSTTVGSYRHLVAALYSIGYSGLAEKLQQSHRISASSFDQLWKPTVGEEVAEAKYIIQQEDEQIKEKYAEFMILLQELLKRRRVRVDDMKLFFNCLQGNDKALTTEMRRTRSIPSFMQSFSRTHSWWNIRISSSIASHFGGDEGIKLVESYKTKLEGHLLRRITLKLPIVGKAKEIVFKVNRDYNCYSEENIDEFRHVVSKLLKLEPWQFVFVNVEQGCVKSTFLISSIYVDRIQDIIHQLKEYGVTSLRIDGIAQWSVADGHKDEQNRMDQQQSKRVKELEEFGHISLPKSKKSKTVYRSGDLFVPTRTQYHRCPRRKLSLLIIIIVLLVLFFLYIVFQQNVY